MKGETWTYPEELTLVHPCVLAVGAWLALTRITAASDLSLATAAALATIQSVSGGEMKTTPTLEAKETRKLERRKVEREARKAG
jgi:hypothetical protein